MEPAAAKAKPQGRLLLSTQLDAKDELEEKLERCVGIVQGLTNGLSEREANDALTANVCKGQQQHEEVCLGLFTLALTEAAQAQRCYRDLTLLNRDGMNVILVKINQILMEKFLKLHDVPRTQLVWLVRELVKSGVIGADGVVMTLLKQIAGGDISTKNLWLAENVLDILLDQKEWVLKSGMLIAMSVYTYLRLIVDHGTPNLLILRQKEVDYCISMLREKFMECLIIGRDLVRLLQNVARIPEMELVWKDLLHNPAVLSPQFTGLLQLLTARTSRKFLACRLTPDMETKLLFMTSRVRFGQQKRYQDWFQRQYLSTAESQSLRCDLIRYICGVVHPSNEVLSSDILPRWAIIGWLLTTCTSNVAASNAKLALFYDWLFFNPEKDSIMNIEPAILVMHHSMKPHPAITATLLDFMCRIIPHFFPPLESQVRQGVFNSLTFIMEKRVLAHLAPLFDNPKLDRELRSMLRERFPEFCSSPSPPTEVKMEEASSLEMDNHVLDKEEGCYDSTEAAFSDDEEEVNNKGKKREFRFHPIKEAVIEEPADITPWIDQLDDTMKEKVLQLQKSSDTDTQCEVMQEIVDLILEEDFDTEQMSALASCLSELFKDHFRGDVLPEEITEESLEESVCKPVCLVFRNLVTMQEDNSGFSVLLDMLAELYQKQPKIGYHLLYYLKASKAANGKMMLYESFAQATALGDLHTCLMMDMKACQEDDVRLLCYLTPSIYSEFPDETLRSGELLNMIVAVIDSTQLQELMCHVMMGTLVMFRKDSVLNILKGLGYKKIANTLKQSYNTVAKIIQRFSRTGSTLNRPRQGRPEKLSPCAQRHIQRLASKNRQMSATCIAAEVEEVEGQPVSAQTIRRTLHHIGLHGRRPRRKPLLKLMHKNAHKQFAEDKQSKNMAYWNQVLWSDETKINWFGSDGVKRVWQHPGEEYNHLQPSMLVKLGRRAVYQHDNDPKHTSNMTTALLRKLKVKVMDWPGFSDLFALAEEYEDSQSKPLKSRRKAPATSPRSRKGAAPPTNNDEESGSSSASEEEDSKPKAPKRKRKGSSAVGSDSD
ncbi:integrator complex subunit 3 [Scomber japonicus]|uniref:integrator complex subunit 3 n=1 Tax=Scomber japonicus TaxID=13676 RepID=UPI0023059F5C|nr:integrator complex subunit 3 [Scomber japonicus]